ncbi:MAG TPA: hypothetical protein VFU22_28850 [Roseiflexaceae bacterium]|nr:hypothetical protein [Roseiflexaceae bacterium]
MNIDEIKDLQQLLAAHRQTLAILLKQTLRDEAVEAADAPEVKGYRADEVISAMVSVCCKDGAGSVGGDWAPSGVHAGDHAGVAFMPRSLEKRYKLSK